MQSQNSPRIFLLAGIGILIAVVFVVGVTVFLAQPPDDKGTAYDKTSQTEVSDPEGKTPENYNEDAAQPTFLGFEKLLKGGISSIQLSGIKSAFTTYAQQTTPRPNRVSLDVSNIDYVLPAETANGHATASFSVVLDDKIPLSTTVEYYGLGKVILHLKDAKTQKEVFTSDLIDTSEVRDD